MVTGFAVGWTIHNGIVALLEGVALLLLFAFAMSWIGIWLGASVPSVEVAQQVSFTILFPITFVSTAFVPLAALPDWLQPFAVWNPVSTLTVSLRELWGNPNPSVLAADSPGDPAADPRHDHLGHRHRRDLRAARHPPLPIAEPLTCSRRPGCSVSGWSWRCSSCCPRDASSSPG